MVNQSNQNLIFLKIYIDNSGIFFRKYPIFFFFKIRYFWPNSILCWLILVFKAFVIMSPKTTTLVNLVENKLVTYFEYLATMVKDFCKTISNLLHIYFDLRTKTYIWLDVMNLFLTFQIPSMQGIYNKKNMQAIFIWNCYFFIYISQLFKNSKESKFT